MPALVDVVSCRVAFRIFGDTKPNPLRGRHLRTIRRATLPDPDAIQSVYAATSESITSAKPRKMHDAGRSNLRGLGQGS